MNGSKALWQMLYWDLSGFSKEEENTALWNGNIITCEADVPVITKESPCTSICESVICI